MPPPYQTMADSSSTPPRAAPAGRREDLAEAKRLYERALLEIPTEYPARRWYSAIPLLQQSCELGSPEAKALLAYAIFQEHGGLNYTSAPFRSEEEWNRYVLHGLIKRLDDMDNMTPAELLMGGLGCRMFQSVSNLDKDGGVYATFLKHAYQRTSNNVVEHIAGCFLADHIMKPFESRMESRDQSLLTNETWSTGAKLMNTVATQGHARANKDMAMFLVHYLQFDKAITYMDKAAEQDYPGAAELASKIRELTNKGSSSRKKDKDCVVM
ncbi:hypothetical protein M427DRAFT_120123 [Gonapodya prolifera JEL478]|uniref:Uncharacterized protein n=1 Tax=Gonapodya prolifera (strain JEL478) TaxID=1344416 RepID=A0A139ASG8_GONPJ|nr:hypothetical protein M427DRAFT_120123 [Gonapodya prolifera JEL478]|eukprot:KXS19687.1 hypothetical protein M427DRAFT_120123 [Gonapodya prolifera JEL478]